jgi:hypothetical protein
MKYDVTLPVLDHRGRPMKLNADSTASATLRDMIEVVCVGNSDVVKTSDEKVQVYRILQRATAADPILELDAKEVDLLKRMIGAGYPAAIVGPLFDVLESPGSKPSSESKPVVAEAPRAARR